MNQTNSKVEAGRAAAAAVAKGGGGEERWLAGWLDAKSDAMKILCTYTYITVAAFETVKRELIKLDRFLTNRRIALSCTGSPRKQAGGVWSCRRCHQCRGCTRIHIPNVVWTSAAKVVSANCEWKTEASDSRPLRVDIIVAMNTRETTHLQARVAAAVDRYIHNM